jgi:hypothetical protein
VLWGRRALRVRECAAAAATGLLALPYTLAFEVLGPFLQTTGYSIMIILILLHDVSWWYAAAYLLVPLLNAQLQSGYFSRMLGCGGGSRCAAVLRV